MGVQMTESIFGIGFTLFFGQFEKGEL